jgi:serine/threonine protein kinase
MSMPCQWARAWEFEILALLGVGGFGMVYKAFDHSLHRAVAIKEFMPAALATRGGDGALVPRSPGPACFPRRPEVFCG